MTKKVKERKDLEHVGHTVTKPARASKTNILDRVSQLIKRRKGKTSAVYMRIPQREKSRKPPPFHSQRCSLGLLMAFERHNTLCVSIFTRRMAERHKLSAKNPRSDTSGKDLEYAGHAIIKLNVRGRPTPATEVPL